MPNTYLDKLIQLYRILYNETDDKHMLTRAEITDRLRQQGLDMNRQTFAVYLKKLKECQFDIMEEKTDHFRYGLGARVFDFAEIKLISDAILSSSAIDEEKSDILVRKLHQLLSRYQSQELSQEQLAGIRKKPANRFFYQNVDMINEGILNNQKIAFRYFTYQVNDQGALCRISRREGREYIVSPYSFCWVQDNYYVLVSDDRHDSLASYRIDRMDCVRLIGENRKPLRECHLGELKDISQYVANMFSMHSGDQGQSVKAELEFSDSVLNVVVDKFGESGIYRRHEDKIVAHFDVIVSPVFYGWLFQLKDQIRIVGPATLAADYREYLKAVAEQYN